MTRPHLDHDHVEEEGRDIKDLLLGVGLLLPPGLGHLQVLYGAQRSYPNQVTNFAILPLGATTFSLYF